MTDELLSVRRSDGVETGITDLDPTDVNLYEALPDKGALTILWHFIRVDPTYVAAWSVFAEQPSDTPEAKRAARRFGMRRFVSPTSVWPDEGLLLPTLPGKAVKETPGTVALQFYPSDDIETQLGIAHFTLLSKTRQRIPAVPVARSYTNHRLAFLLRVLHFHLLDCELTAAVPTLAKMKNAWRDLMASGGRREKDSTYTVRKYQADVKAALKIRDELVVKLLNEARMSLYEGESA